MRAFSKFLPLVAAALVAFVGSASAQIITSYETQTDYSGSVTTFGASGGSATKGEIFTNVSAVKAMTYNFFAGTAGISSATTLSATFGEWNGVSFVGGTTVSFGTITIPASTDVSWASTLAVTGAAFNNYSYSFDFTTLSGSLINATYGYLTDSTKAYALMLTNTTGSVTNLGLGLNTADNPDYGYKGFAASGEDWVFSQIVVYGGNQQLVPVPESSTVASLAVGAMVFGLVGFRMNQRRRAAVAPVAAA